MASTTVNLSQLNTAIVTTMEELVVAGVVNKVEDISELSEGIQDQPMMQVYWQSIVNDVSGSTDRTTFRGGVRQQDIVFHVDIYAQQRAHIGEDMSAMLTVVDAVIDKLEEQNIKPYFGLTEDAIRPIKAFSWQGDRAEFRYGDYQYVGARFTLSFRVF